MHIEEEIRPLVDKVIKGTEKNMSHALGIHYTEITRKRMSAKMPVNENTRQPFGILHGGASVALGETLCSFGAWLNTDPERYNAVGAEINANHLRAVASGEVTGTAWPLHVGATTQVWQYEIRDAKDALVCTGRCTLVIVKKRLPG